MASTVKRTTIFWELLLWDPPFYQKQDEDDLEMSWKLVDYKCFLFGFSFFLATSYVLIQHAVVTFINTFRHSRKVQKKIGSVQPSGKQKIPEQKQQCDPTLVRALTSLRKSPGREKKKLTLSRQQQESKTLGESGKSAKGLKNTPTLIKKSPSPHRKSSRHDKSPHRVADVDNVRGTKIGNVHDSDQMNETEDLFTFRKKLRTFQERVKNPFALDDWTSYGKRKRKNKRHSKRGCNARQTRKSSTRRRGSHTKRKGHKTTGVKHNDNEQIMIDTFEKVTCLMNDEIAHRIDLDRHGVSDSSPSLTNSSTINLRRNVSSKRYISSNRCRLTRCNDNGDTYGLGHDLNSEYHSFCHESLDDSNAFMFSRASRHKHRNLHGAKMPFVGVTRDHHYSSSHENKDIKLKKSSSFHNTIHYSEGRSIFNNHPHSEICTRPRHESCPIQKPSRKNNVLSTNVQKSHQAYEYTYPHSVMPHEAYCIMTEGQRKPTGNMTLMGNVKQDTINKYEENLASLAHCARVTCVNQEHLKESDNDADLEMHSQMCNDMLPPTVNDSFRECHAMDLKTGQILPPDQVNHTMKHGDTKTHLVNKDYCRKSQGERLYITNETCTQAVSSRNCVTNKDESRVSKTHKRVDNAYLHELSYLQKFTSPFERLASKALTKWFTAHLGDQNVKTTLLSLCQTHINEHPRHGRKFYKIRRKCFADVRYKPYAATFSPLYKQRTHKTRQKPVKILTKSEKNILKNISLQLQHYVNQKYNRLITSKQYLERDKHEFGSGIKNITQHDTKRSKSCFQKTNEQLPKPPAMPIYKEQKHLGKQLKNDDLISSKPLLTLRRRRMVNDNNIKRTYDCSMNKSKSPLNPNNGGSLVKRLYVMEIDNIQQLDGYKSKIHPDGFQKEQLKRGSDERTNYKGKHEIKDCRLDELEMKPKMDTWTGTKNDISISSDHRSLTEQPHIKETNQKCFENNAGIPLEHQVNNTHGLDRERNSIPKSEKSPWINNQAIAVPAVCNTDTDLLYNDDDGYTCASSSEADANLDGAILKTSCDITKQLARTLPQRDSFPLCMEPKPMTRRKSHIPILISNHRIRSDQEVTTFPKDQQDWKTPSFDKRLLNTSNDQTTNKETINEEGQELNALSIYNNYLIAKKTEWSNRECISKQATSINDTFDVGEKRDTEKTTNAIDILSKEDLKSSNENGDNIHLKTEESERDLGLVSTKPTQRENKKSCHRPGKMISHTMSPKLSNSRERLVLMSVLNELEMSPVGTVTQHFDQPEHAKKRENTPSPNICRDISPVQSDPIFSQNSPAIGGNKLSYLFSPREEPSAKNTLTYPKQKAEKTYGGKRNKFAASHLRQHIQKNLHETSSTIIDRDNSVVKKHLFQLHQDHKIRLKGTSPNFSVDGSQDDTLHKPAAGRVSNENVKTVSSRTRHELMKEFSRGVRERNKKILKNREKQPVQKAPQERTLREKRFLERSPPAPRATFTESRDAQKQNAKMRRRTYIAKPTMKPKTAQWKPQSKDDRKSMINTETERPSNDPTAMVAPCISGSKEKLTEIQDDSDRFRITDSIHDENAYIHFGLIHPKNKEISANYKEDNTDKPPTSLPVMVKASDQLAHENEYSTLEQECPQNVDALRKKYLKEIQQRMDLEHKVHREETNWYTEGSTLSGLALDDRLVRSDDDTHSMQQQLEGNKVKKDSTNQICDSTNFVNEKSREFPNKDTSMLMKSLALNIARGGLSYDHVVQKGRGDDYLETSQATQHSERQDISIKSHELYTVFSQEQTTVKLSIPISLDSKINDHQSACRFKQDQIQKSKRSSDDCLSWVDSTLRAHRNATRPLDMAQTTHGSHSTCNVANEHVMLCASQGNTPEAILPTHNMHHSPAKASLDELGKSSMWSGPINCPSEGCSRISHDSKSNVEEVVVNKINENECCNSSGHEQNEQLRLGRYIKNHQEKAKVGIIAEDIQYSVDGNKIGYDGKNNSSVSESSQESKLKEEVNLNRISTSLNQYDNQINEFSTMFARLTPAVDKGTDRTRDPRNIIGIKDKEDNHCNEIVNDRVSNEQAKVNENASCFDTKLFEKPLGVQHLGRKRQHLGHSKYVVSALQHFKNKKKPSMAYMNQTWNKKMSKKSSHNGTARVTTYSSPCRESKRLSNWLTDSSDASKSISMADWNMTFANNEKIGLYRQMKNKGGVYVTSPTKAWFQRPIHLIRGGCNGIKSKHKKMKLKCKKTIRQFPSLDIHLANRVASDGKERGEVSVAHPSARDSNETYTVDSAVSTSSQISFDWYKPSITTSEPMSHNPSEQECDTEDYSKNACRPNPNTSNARSTGRDWRDINVMSAVREQPVKHTDHPGKSDQSISVLTNRHRRTPETVHDPQSARVRQFSCNDKTTNTNHDDTESCLIRVPLSSSGRCLLRGSSNSKISTSLVTTSETMDTTTLDSILLDDEQCSQVSVNCVEGFFAEQSIDENLPYGQTTSSNSTDRTHPSLVEYSTNVGTTTGLTSRSMSRIYENVSNVTESSSQSASRMKGSSHRPPVSQLVKIFEKKLVMKTPASVGM